MNKPQIFTGNADYKTSLYYSNCFVDKTLLIRDLLKGNKSVFLITRPRRWGKTTNLRMLEYFFDLEVDTVTKLPLEIKANKVLFEGGEVILEHGDSKILNKLNIAKEEDGKLLIHQGIYPTIYLDFKTIKGSTFEEIKSKLKIQIFRAYDKYGIDYEDLIKKHGEMNFLSISLFELTKRLWEKYGKSSCILIDEYDAPLNEILVEITSKIGDIDTKLNLFKHVSSFMGEIFTNGLKDNGHLRLGVLTGILRVAKANMFSDLNNVYEDSVLTGRFSEHYGFTIDEIEGLLAKYNDFELEEISKWYNGYIIGGIKIYNPWSVVNRLIDKNMTTPWKNSGSQDLIKNIMTSDIIQDKLNELILGKHFEVNFEDFSLDNLKNTEEVIWPLLLYSGYLTTTKQPSYDMCSKTYKASVSIPNQEIDIIFHDFLKQWIRNNLDKISKIDFSQIDLESQFEVREKYLAAIKLTQTNFGRMNEAIFHHLVTGRHMFAKGQREHKIYTEYLCGEGKVDHFFYPSHTSKSHVAIIHEYKFTSKKDLLEEIILEGLWQIYERQYMNGAITMGKLDKKIDRIIVRSIVILLNEGNEIDMILKENIHRFEDAITIINYFNSHQEHPDTANIHRNKAKTRNLLLKQNGKKNLEELIVAIKDKSLNKTKDCDYKEEFKVYKSTEKNVYTTTQDVKDFLRSISPTNQRKKEEKSRQKRSFKETFPNEDFPLRKFKK